jgi:hypothetical protein
LQGTLFPCLPDILCPPFAEIHSPLLKVKYLTLLLLSLLPFASGFAERFSRHSVRAMCLMADAIVVGSIVEGDTVRVEKWIRPASSATPLPDTITISNLSNHLREPGRHIGDTSPRKMDLPLRRFMAFLQKSGESWECLDTAADSSTRPGCGSSGMVWIFDEKCYAYSQTFSPGPYQLFPVEDLAKWGVFNPYVDWIEPVTTEALLLAEIDAGLKDVAAWNEVLAEPDPAKKASRLAAYYLPGTSPVGKRKTFLFGIEPHISELREYAVPALVKALQSSQPEDDLTALFWTLRRLPTNTEATIPALSKLLGNPLTPPPRYLIECLGYSQSPQILPALLPYLLSPYPHVRESAAGAIQNIAPDCLSPADLAKTSPLIAIVETFPVSESLAPAPDPTRRPLCMAILKQNLKGTISKKLFVIETPADPAYEDLSSDFSYGRALVFLRQDDQGRYLPSSPESFKRFTSYPNGEVSWPREHKILLEKIQSIILSVPSALSPAGS